MSIDVEVERARFVKAMRVKYSLPDRIDPFSFGWLTEKEFDIWLAAKRDAENSRTPAKPDDAPIDLCARKGGCVCTGHFERDRSVCRHWRRDAEQEAKS